MFEPLNYRPSNSAVYYTAPARIDLLRTIAGTALATVFAIGGAVLYAKRLPDVSNLILRGGAVCAASISVGVIGFIAVQIGRIRIPAVAALLGVMLGLMVLYVMWLVWMHDVIWRIGLQIPYWKLVRHPIPFLRLIRSINRAGTWSIGGSRVYGPPLLFLWLGEAGLILAGAVLMPMKGIKDEDPICRTCRSKCRSIGRLPRFDADQEVAFIAAIENRDFVSLVTFDPPKDEDAPELTM